MIQTAEQLRQGIEQKRRMHSLLESYGRDLLRQNRPNFALFAGPVDGIRKLQPEIDDSVRRLGRLAFQPEKYPGTCRCLRLREGDAPEAHVE